MSLAFRRNFSSRARELSGADALVISIPKSGRTWVRTFLCAYYCKKYGHEMTLEPERYRDARIPRVIYSHDVFEHRTKADLWGRIRGKYLVPPLELRRARMLLLVRDPRDAFVSHYVQLTRRTQETAGELKGKTMGEVLRDSKYGIDLIIETMNGWLKEFCRRPDFVVVRYEALRTEPEIHFRAVLGALGENMPDERAYAHALEFSNFDQMKKMETAGAFDSKILQPGDVHDPESFKVRRGKVGGYEDYLSPADLEYAAKAMLGLDPRFGYRA